MHITDSVSVSVSKMAWEPLTYIGIRMLFLKLFLLLLYLQRFLSYMILCHMPLLSFASSHTARFTLCVRIFPKKKFLQMIWEPLIYIGIGLLIPELFSLLLYLYRFNFQKIIKFGLIGLAFCTGRPSGMPKQVQQDKIQTVKDREKPKTVLESAAQFLSDKHIPKPF